MLPEIIFPALLDYELCGKVKNLWYMMSELRSMKQMETKKKNYQLDELKKNK